MPLARLLCFPELKTFLQTVQPSTLQSSCILDLIFIQLNILYDPARLAFMQVRYSAPLFVQAVLATCPTNLLVNSELVACHLALLQAASALRLIGSLSCRISIHDVNAKSTMACQQRCHYLPNEWVGLIELNHQVLFPQAKVHEAIVQFISTHCMTATDNNYDDVFSSLMDLCQGGVWRCVVKIQPSFVTKRPALAAMLAKALQGYVAIVEKQMAETQRSLLERAAAKAASRIALIRNMIYNPESMQNSSIIAAGAFPISAFLHLMHYRIDGPHPKDGPAMRMANLLLHACYGLCRLGKSLTGLMQRLGVLEATLG